METTKDDVSDRFRHVRRRVSGYIENKVLKTELAGKTKKGRPKRRFMIGLNM